MGFWPGPPLNLAKIRCQDFFPHPATSHERQLPSTTSQNLEVDQNENKFSILTNITHNVQQIRNT